MYLKDHYQFRVSKCAINIPAPTFKEIQEVPLDDLILYTHYPYKTREFFKLLDYNNKTRRGNAIERGSTGH
jgi:hypothetical protein